MPRGNERPSITRAKNTGQGAPLSKEIREVLGPYLPGMLKTIGMAGAGKQRRGAGDLKAALGGVKLMIDSIGRSSGDSEILNLLKGVQGDPDDEWNDEDYFDDDEDTELETLQDEIDELTNVR